MRDRRADEKRLQEIFTALVQRRIGDSLAQVEQALAAWRAGERTVLAAHAEVLRHAARTNVLSNRVARAGLEGPARLLRDALDAGLLTDEEFFDLTGERGSEVTPFPSLDEEAARAVSPEMPDKRSVMGKLLQDGPVLVHLDPRSEEVRVPSAHRGEPRLVLRFGYNLSPPILDLALEDKGLVGTLTFRGVPFRCEIPWSAVFALVGEEGRGLVWAEDVPAELAHEYQRVNKPDAKDRDPERPDLLDHSDAPDADRSDADPPNPDGPRGGPTRSRSHLKLV
jgi:stringent starvation protein B